MFSLASSRSATLPALVVAFRFSRLLALVLLSGMGIEMSFGMSAIAVVGERVVVVVVVVVEVVDVVVVVEVVEVVVAVLVVLVVGVGVVELMVVSVELLMAFRSLSVRLPLFEVSTAVPLLSTVSLPVLCLLITP